MYYIKWRYRICSVCGRKWNVSKLGRSSKQYICPWCTSKKTPSEAATSTES